MLIRRLILYSKLPSHCIIIDEFDKLLTSNRPSWIKLLGTSVDYTHCSYIYHNAKKCHGASPKIDFAMMAPQISREDLNRLTREK